MKQATYITSFAVFGLLAVSSAALAQQDRQQPRTQEQPRMQQEQVQQQMMLVHADDEIVNANVRNVEAEDLGTIDALVVEAGTGQIGYAIVSFGGFLGIGDTLHAVPWTAFEHRPMYEGLVLNVTRSQLEAQRGFERDQLPNFADQTWAQNIHREYNQEPYWEQRERMPWNDNDIQDDLRDNDDWNDGMRDNDMRDNNDQQRPGERQPMQPRTGDMQQRQYITTYDLIGMEVENPQGENVGTIRDFAVQFETGEIEHVVLAYGGWLGIGETHTALPWDAFQPQRLDTDQPQMILDVTQDQLRRAPEYRHDRWPRMGAADWAQDMGIGERREPREPRDPRRLPGQR